MPIEARHHPADYYFAMMTCGDVGRRRQYAYEWTRYEASRLALVPPSEEQLRKEILAGPFVSLAMMEAYYFRNAFFMDEDFILENIFRIPRNDFSFL